MYVLAIPKKEGHLETVETETGNLNKKNKNSIQIHVRAKNCQNKFVLTLFHVYSSIMMQ